MNKQRYSNKTTKKKMMERWIPVEGHQGKPLQHMLRTIPSRKLIKMINKQKM